nr:DUF1513 domain-containing protein [uncultured Ruegeria sp.]
MTTRRRFLAGLTAAGLAPMKGWASVGGPDYLAAALFPDDTYRLAGLDVNGTILFSLPLPARGHAAAAQPHLPQAVAFARRPGTFAAVIDCATGVQIAELQAPKGRHFYGHGTYSRDGTRLYTTENDYDAGAGIIGIWNGQDYTRIGEISSGGIGPHDLSLMPDGVSLVVANGGIETHPDTGRTKLNLPVMQPNLTYLDLSGDILETVELPRAMHKSSTRHLAVRRDGLVAFAMQWQGAASDHPPLLGLHYRGQAPRLLSAPDTDQATLQGYAGSVAFSANGETVAITCPRGNALHQFNVADGRLVSIHKLDDVCGLSAGPKGYVFTTGTGVIGSLIDISANNSAQPDCQWDNHLIPVRAFG